MTDWNPLTVYIYNECYIRFAILDYDIKNKSKLAHLTNNCIAKEYRENQASPNKNKPHPNNKKESSPGEEEDDDIDDDPDNIWSTQDF